MSKKSSLTLIGGGKGGVGKSMLAMATIDYYRSNNRPVILIEAEPENSDVFHSYRDVLGLGAVHAINLMQGVGGWHQVGDLVHKQPGAEFVINTPGGMTNAYQSYGQQIASLTTITDRFTTLWPINRLRDPVQLLAHFVDAVPGVRVGVVKNLFFGPPDRFSRFETSEFKANNPQIRVGNLPELDDDLIDIIDNRVAIENVKPDGIMRQITMRNWRNTVHAMLKEIL